MKKLRESGYIEMDKDGFISLLPSGEEIARRIYERHKLLTQFFIRLGVFSQIKRATNCAIPGYSVSAIIPRRGRKSKIFLSVVIYVVKPTFVPLSAIVENPANAGVKRLCGVSPCPVPDTATALPKQARYQLR